MTGNILNKLEEIESSLRSLKSLVSLHRGQFIAKTSTRTLSKDLATKWFDAESILSDSYSIGKETIDKYHSNFDKLLSLALSQNSRKGTYTKSLDEILRNFKGDLIKPVLKAGKVNQKWSSLDDVLNHVNEKEKEYLEEAVKCANLGFIRASVILGWCAAISRIHAVIEKIGFDEFNKKSNEMKSKPHGRYKRFNKLYSVGTLNELQAEVFDNDLLWVIEYMSLVDSNQHDRLSLCFTMRNNCAHPGDAPISPENLISFYSDIDKIIFTNPKFML